MTRLKITRASEIGSRALMPATPRLIKVYKGRCCDRNHRSHYVMAKCIFRRRAEWIIGDGPYAVLAWCSVLTVSLHPTLTDAITSYERITREGPIGMCGHACHNKHDLVRLDGASQSVRTRPQRARVRHDADNASRRLL